MQLIKKKDIEQCERLELIQITSRNLCITVAKHSNILTNITTP